MESIEENVHGAELQLSLDAIKEIRQLTEAADTGGCFGFEVLADSMP